MYTSWYPGHNTHGQNPPAGQNPPPYDIIPLMALVYDIEMSVARNVDMFINGVKRSNKKDGYRQQNVRQRQKLISIIDYDV